MNGRIIDAKARFKAGRQKASPENVDSAEEARAQWDQRSLRQKREAAELRSFLRSTARLDTADRKIVARNLGRSIERHHDRRPTQMAADLLRIAWGQDGGASREKKRKRYIRFDGEPLADHGPGEEYAASGSDYLRLAESLADLLNQGLPEDVARDQMLLTVCDGASFYGPARPHLQQDMSLADRFRQAMTSMMDRVVRSSDVVAYISEAQNYSIKGHPYSYKDVSSEVRKALHRQTLPIDRFSHAPETHYDGYSRLSLGGFDIKTEGPSGLLPATRIARIYWPQQVLCLPAFVSTAALQALGTSELTSCEMQEALNAAPRFDSSSEEEHRWRAVSEWRANQKHELWLDTIRAAGFDPETMDWRDLEDPLTGEAQHRSVWRTYWEALSVDLHLVADGRPDALHFGLSFNGGGLAHWAAAPKSLLRPSDDDKAFVDRNFIYYSRDSVLGPTVPWYEDGEKTYVTRGLLHERDLPCDDELFVETERIEFGPEKPEIFSTLMDKPVWPLHAHQVWEILTIQMDDWQGSSSSWGSKVKHDDLRPRLRPLFQAPQGWSPAPDGSLASAILRSIAHGEGAERLDERFIAAANNLVRCFRDMKEGLSQDFEKALARNGYDSL
jgi:hypothetical protein